MSTFLHSSLRMELPNRNWVKCYSYLHLGLIPEGGQFYGLCQILFALNQSDLSQTRVGLGFIRREPELKLLEVELPEEVLDED